jgi:hypothetical protein
METQNTNPKFCFTLKVLNMELVNLEVSGTADFRPRWLIITFVSLFMIGMFTMSFGPSLAELYQGTVGAPEVTTISPSPDN